MRSGFIDMEVRASCGQRFGLRISYPQCIDDRPCSINEDSEVVVSIKVQDKNGPSRCRRLLHANISESPYVSR